MGIYTILSNRLLLVLTFFWCVSTSAQFYRNHYIAPATWQYLSNANAIVVTTNSTTSITATIKKSDGTLVTTVNVVKGAPAVYVPPTSYTTLSRHAVNRVLIGAGLIVTAPKPISVELRNIQSDNPDPGTGSTAPIKGNALLISFGDAGIGKSFRVGYYRSGNLSGSETPTYSVMAIDDNTDVFLNGVKLTTLNAGQSYLFKAAIGALVTTSDFVVMNTGSHLDAPGGCGDGSTDQIPPLTSLGTQYIVVKGQGNETAEQTTVIATEAATELVITIYNSNGSFNSTVNKTLVNAGDSYQFINGVVGSSKSGSSSRITANKKVVAYTGTAYTCEVDVVTVMPLSACSGSFFLETSKFVRNNGTVLPYYGFVFLPSATAIVSINGSNLETLAGARRQLGTSGWYLIDFTNTEVGNPATLSLSSTEKFTMEMVQTGGGFSMASFFSSVADVPERPTVVYNAGDGCTNGSATLTAIDTYDAYKWFLDGEEIAGATSKSHVATRTGIYTIGAFLPCGAFVESLPVKIVLCSDVSVTKTVSNSTPDKGSNIEFTITARNTGNNSTDVSVTDLLPSGYTFVSAVAPIGTSYNSSTGLWNIGGMDAGQSLVLKVVATVKVSGVYKNTATITSSAQPDSNTANNTASVTPVPVDVVVGCEPVPSAVPAIQPSCGSSGTITINSPLGAAYEYKLNNNAYQASPNFTGVSSGTYTVVVRRAANHSCVSSPTTVVVNPVAAIPSQPVLTITQPSCTLQSGRIEVTAPMGAVEYSTNGINYQSSSTFSSLLAGNYTITARNTSDRSCVSTATTATINTIPLNPTVPVAKEVTNIGCNVITANWTSTTNTTKYYLDVSTQNNFDSFVTGYNNLDVGNVIAYPISGLVTGTTYYYRVRAANVNCTSASSNAISGSTSPSTPVAPAMSNGTAVSCTSFNANWAVATNASAYFLDVSRSSSFSSFVTNYESVNVGNVTSYTVTGLDSGVLYYYRVRALNGCGTSSSSIVKNNTTLISPTAPTIGTVTQPTCKLATGSVVLNGLPEGNWIINPGAISGTGSSYTVTSLTSGTYSFTVTNSNGCMSTTSANVKINSQPITPVANAGSDFTQTCSVNLNGAQIGVAGTDGTTYSWSPVEGLSNGAIANPNANPTVTTLYTLTATNSAGGCIATDTVLVTINNILPTANAGPDVVKSCTTNTSGATIGAAAEAGITYSWSPATGLSSTTVSNPIANPTVTTTYTLTATNTSSGCTSTDTVLVTVNTIVPTANAGADVAKTCTSNSSGALIGTTAVAGTTYSWSPSAGLSGAAIANPTANPSATTTYTVTATNTASGCTATDTVVVTVNTLVPLVNAGTDVTKTCVSNPTGAMIGMDAVNGITYSWSPTNGLDNPTTSKTAANPLATTNYNLTATNTTNGCISTDAVLVTVNTNTPTANAGADFTKNCLQNQSGKQIGMTAETGVKYSWSPVIGLSSASISNPIANPTETTTYTLTATNESSGCFTKDEIVITVNKEAPVANAGTSFTKTYVTNPQGKSIGTDAVAGTTYSWSPSTGLSSNSVSNPIANPSVTTLYTLTSTSTLSGCTSTSTVLVTVNLEVSTADAGLDFTKTCSANANGKQIGVNSVVGTTYSWSPSAGLSNALISNPTANPLVTTTYTLTAKNTASGFTATDTVIVTVDTNAPIADAGPDVVKSCLINKTGAMIGVAGIIGTTYSWSPTTGLSDAAVANPTANPVVTTSYTLTANNTANGCATTDTVLVTVNTITPTANAGADFEQNCLSNLNGAKIGATAEAGTTYSWSPISGLSSGTISNPTANPSVTTTYSLTATNVLGGCSTTDTVVVTINNTLPIADAGTPFTKTCATNISGVPIGATAVAGTTYSWSPATGLSDATISNPTANPTVTTMYTLTATNTFSGCTATRTVVVTVNTTPPAAPIVGNAVQPNCNTATGSVVLSGLPAGSWTINPGAISGSGSSHTILGLSTGTYNFIVVNASGCSSNASANVVINAQPETPAKPSISNLVQPTCAIGGSVLISGLPAGTWTLNQSGTSTGLITGNTVTKTVDNLLPGTYKFVAVSDKGCISVGTDDVVMGAVTGSTVVSVVQPTCSVATGTVSFSDLINGWTIVQQKSGNADVTYTNATYPTLNFTTPALASGDYNFVITSGVICASSTRVITINPQPQTPAKPSFTYTPPTCDIAQGTFVVGDLPATHWEVEVYKTGLGVIRTVQGIGPSYSETGVFNVGEFTLTVKNEVGCVSDPTEKITSISQPIKPAVPNIGKIEQPTCTVATGSVVLSGLPTGTWTINPGNISGSGASHTISDLTYGTYNFTITSDTGCTSLATSDVVINKQPVKPTPPVIGFITQPTCDSEIASVELSGLPVGNWKLTVNVAGIRVTDFFGSGTTTILSGATAGTYNGTVTDLTEGCTSDLTANYVVNPQPNKPATPVLGAPTQPTCTVVTGSVKITNWDSSITYIVTPDTNVFVVGSVITAPAGTYTVKALFGDCESSESVPFEITRALVVPSAPIVGTIEQMTCKNDLATFELTGLPAGNWKLKFNDADNSEISNTGSSIYIQADINSVGTFNVTVTNADQCTSPASLPIVIAHQPITPAAPIVGVITQPTCTVAAGSVVLSGLPTGTWTIAQLDIFGNSARVPISGNTSETTITGLTAGRYRFTVSNGNCTSLETIDVVINEQPATPTAPIPGILTQPTCDSSLASIEITGLPQGNWTLTGTGGNELKGSGTSTFVTTNMISAVAGTYKMKVINELGCESPLSTEVTLNPQPFKPDVPIITNKIQPTCTVATGSFEIQGYDPGFTYLVEPNIGIISIGNKIIAPTGIYTVKAMSENCESAESLAVTINEQPATPTPPIVGRITHPSCESAYGSVALSGLPAGQWEIDVDVIGLRHTLFYGSGPTTIIFGTTSGTYQGTVKDLATGCTSVSIPVQTLNPRPAIPTAPIIGKITQPTCTEATASVVLNGLPEGNWTINQIDVLGSSSKIIHTGNTPETIITGLKPGIHKFTVDNGNCISSESMDVVIDDQPVTPTAPIIGKIVQPTCDSELASIEIEGLPLGEWKLVTTLGTTITGYGTSVYINLANAESGARKILVVNSQGCSSPYSEEYVLEQKPIKPSVLTIDSLQQPSCTGAQTGTIVLGNLPQGDWTITQMGTVESKIQGATSSHTISGLSKGLYEFYVTNSVGCDSNFTESSTIESMLCANDDFNENLENETITVSVDSPENLLKNDFSQDGSSIKITAFYANGLSQDPGSTAHLPQGDLTVNNDGSYSFKPAMGYSGQLIVSYIISNKSKTATANLVLVVTPLSDLLVAQDDAVITKEDFLVIVYVLNNDAFGKQGPDVTPLVISTQPSHGTAVVNDNDTPDDFIDDTVTYTPNSGFYGNDSFVYTISNLNKQTASAKVTIQIEQLQGATLNGRIFDKSNGNAPLGNVPITLIPQAPTTGPILYQLTRPDGSYSFYGMDDGDYLFHVQDVHLNRVSKLFPIESSVVKVVLDKHHFDSKDVAFEYSNLPVMGDCVWYDINRNGIQDEWYDANNDFKITENIPDVDGNIDYSQWEWVDINGDRSYEGEANIGELNSAGFGDSKGFNVQITGPSNYSKTAFVGIQGYWINRFNNSEPWGDYKANLIMDDQYDALAQAMKATQLIKMLPDNSKKLNKTKEGLPQNSEVCGLTDTSDKKILLQPRDARHFDLNFFGVDCKTFAGIFAVNDNVDRVINGTTGEDAVLNVFDNDINNGAKLNLTDVVTKVIVPNPNLVLNFDGTVDVKANTPGGIHTFTYQICEVANPTNCSTAEVTIVVDAPSDKCKLEVFNAISKNNDGKNEELIIKGIDCYPNNKVSIYNRWGVLVYERDQYNNTDKAFKGQSEAKAMMNTKGGLPEGTYYYFIIYKDDLGKENVKKGYLYIKK